MTDGPVAGKRRRVILCYHFFSLSWRENECVRKKKLFFIFDCENRVKKVSEK